MLVANYLFACSNKEVVFASVRLLLLGPCVYFHENLFFFSRHKQYSFSFCQNTVAHGRLSPLSKVAIKVSPIFSIFSRALAPIVIIYEDSFVVLNITLNSHIGESSRSGGDVNCFTHVVYVVDAQRVGMHKSLGTFHSGINRSPDLLIFFIASRIFNWKTEIRLWLRPRIIESSPEKLTFNEWEDFRIEFVWVRGTQP